MTTKTFPTRLFVGTFATGISYADMKRERNGDYLRLAFLPYSTLALEWTPGVKVPADLRAAIVKHAKVFQGARGELYQTSTSGQYVVLGESQRARTSTYNSPPPTPVSPPDDRRPNYARDYGKKGWDWS